MSTNQPRASGEANRTKTKSKSFWSLLRSSKLKRSPSNDNGSAVTGQPGPVSQVNAHDTFVPHGHRYGDANLAGSSTLHQGNSYINAGPQSRIEAPSTMYGSMNVNIHNTCAPPSSSRTQSDLDKEAELRLKETLYYDAMEQRKAQLSKVEPATFDWLWTKTSFPSWLYEGGGIFWIVGKPASGKSTLIHYLTSDEHGLDRVKQHFRKPPIVLHFFFDFRAGQGIPNTPVGMLRALLLQLVEASEAVKTFTVSKTQHRPNGHWPDLESELLDLVCEAVLDTEVLVCGFIDGLDEYTGDLRSLAGMLVRLAERSGMKLCLASRPEPQLIYKLRHYAFSMQDYNTTTIEDYTEGAFNSLPFDLQSSKLEQLFRRIPEEANGVILWARLAVDEVIAATLKGYNILQIENCLDRFPLELEAVYSRVWSSLDAEHRKLAATMLFVISKWDSMKYHLDMPFRPLDQSKMLLTCDILFKLIGSAQEPLSDLDPSRFKKLVHSTLQGLIEVVDKVSHCEFRLVHKTFNSYVQQSQEIINVFNQLSRAIHNHPLQPWFWAVAMLASSKKSDNADIYRLYPEVQHLARDLRVIRIDQLLKYRGFLGVNDPIDAIGHVMRHLLEPQHLQLLLHATSSSFFREMLLRDKYEGEQAPSSLLMMPELALYASSNWHQALVARAADIEHKLCNEARDHLLTMLLAQLYISWLFFYEYDSTESDDAISKSIMVLLSHQSWQAHFITLCSVPAKHALSDSISRSISAFGKVSDHLIMPARWWIYGTTHVSLCFAWASVYPRSLSTQELRVQSLRHLGVSLEGRIYAGGDIFDAMFEDKLAAEMSWRPLPSFNLHFHRNYYRSPEGMTMLVPFFSKAKFSALLLGGIELGGYDRTEKLLQSARKLLRSYKQKGAVYLKIFAKHKHHYYVSDQECVVALCRSMAEDESRDDVEGFRTQWEDIEKRSRGLFPGRSKLWGAFEYMATIHDLESHVIPFLEQRFLPGCVSAKTSFQAQAMTCEACLPHRNSLGTRHSNLGYLENRIPLCRSSYSRVKLPQTFCTSET